MTYIDGFVAAVPQENKQAYLDHVREASRLFKLMANPRMQPNKDKMPFDGQRMIYGGFATVLDA